MLWVEVAKERVRDRNKYVYMIEFEKGKTTQR